MRFNQGILALLVYLSRFWTVGYHYQLFTLPFRPRGYTKVLPEIWEVHESMSSSTLPHSLNSFQGRRTQQACANWRSCLARYVMGSSAYSPASLKWRFPKKEVGKAVWWAPCDEELGCFFSVEGSGVWPGKINPSRRWYQRPGLWRITCYSVLPFAWIGVLYVFFFFFKKCFSPTGTKPKKPAGDKPKTGGGGSLFLFHLTSPKSLSTFALRGSSFFFEFIQWFLS